jgi:hypothetical protein
LPRGRGREPLRVHLPEIPTGRVVQAELGFGEIYLCALPPGEPEGWISVSFTSAWFPTAKRR